MPIRSFKGKWSKPLFDDVLPRGFPPNVFTVARRKLMMLDQSRRLEDLRKPPANRLEALKGDRKGQDSIRINDQWRICFVWSEGYAENVQVVDYH
jgi:proteic killer suppression protein